MPQSVSEDTVERMLRPRWKTEYKLALIIVIATLVFLFALATMLEITGHARVNQDAKTNQMFIQACRTLPGDARTLCLNQYIYNP